MGRYTRVRGWSATIELMRQASESLAGRVAYVNLRPIDALELLHQVGDTNPLSVGGGFPESCARRSSGRFTSGPLRAPPRRSTQENCYKEL